MTIREWGPVTWCLFHTLAECIDDKSDESRALIPELVKFCVEICRSLPCPDCTIHASTYWRNHLARNKIRSGAELRTMLCDFHNFVNARKNKAEFKQIYLTPVYIDNSLENVYLQFTRHYVSRGITQISENFYRRRTMDRLRQWLIRHVDILTKGQASRKAEAPNIQAPLPSVDSVLPKSTPKPTIIQFGSSLRRPKLLASAHEPAPVRPQPAPVRPQPAPVRPQPAQTRSHAVPTRPQLAQTRPHAVPTRPWSEPNSVIRPPPTPRSRPAPKPTVRPNAPHVAPAARRPIAQQRRRTPRASLLFVKTSHKMNR